MSWLDLRQGGDNIASIILQTKRYTWFDVKLNLPVNFIGIIILTNKANKVKLNSYGFEKQS